MNKINIVAPINQLGYGVTGLNVVKQLSETLEVSLFPIGQPQISNQQDADIISQCVSNARLLDFNAPCVKIWHQNDMGQFAGNGLRVGFPIFELNKFNHIEKHHLLSLDKIFVCSYWAKAVIMEDIPSISEDNIHVVPLGVDSEIFAYDHREKPQDVPPPPTIFFNCGKWEIRKGHDILVSLFNKAFEKEDNVELWMMNQNPFLSEQEQNSWIDLYKTSKLGDKIRIINRVNTQEEVYNIMRKTDCGIFPSRAEGWNLELLEMMSCGINVITTNYSAHTQFCGENAFLVPINELEEAFDGKWFLGNGGQWAKIGDWEKNLFIEHMRNIHYLKQNNKLARNRAGIATARHYSWNNTARNIIKYVSV
jgi:glycosyltransferase involved in cell wall biosynthesis